MPTYTIQLIAGFAGVIVMLTMIVFYLIAILHRLNNPVPQPTTVDQIDMAIERLGVASRQYADVNAVVEMIRQIAEGDADAVELLKQYPESVRAAAWLHYINTLGSSLQSAQNELSSDLEYHNPNGVIVMATEAKVHAIRNMLNTAIAASRLSERPAS